MSYFREKFIFTFTLIAGNRKGKFNVKQEHSGFSKMDTCHSGNACYHSVQNILSSSLLSKNLKIKIYITIILPVFCMGVKLGRSH